MWATPSVSSTSTWECTITPLSVGPSTISLPRSQLENCHGRRAISPGTPTAVLLSDRLSMALYSSVRLRNTLSELFLSFFRLTALCVCHSSFHSLSMQFPPRQKKSRNVLQKNLSDGLDDMGSIKWSLALCVLAVFVLVYFSLWKGVRSTGKVSKEYLKVIIT